MTAVERRSIFCANCNADVQARLTNGAEIYPNRPDLMGVPMWRCDGCRQYVGCHWKQKRKPGEPLSTEPLGIIPTPQLRDARRKLHDLAIDPLWKNGLIKRGQLYAMISLQFGREYHTGELRTIEEAREVWRIVRTIAGDLGIGSGQKDDMP